jgi:hypothetical protein|nr:MAG TPA: hypothetical protein [Caudoviricetes sp.]
MFNGSPLDKRPLWYSNPVGEKTSVVDKQGNETGESAYESWSEPAKLMLNVSPPTGSAEANPFGAFTDYSYVVSSSSKKRNTPLYEGTHVWFQTDVSKPFNYTVVKVAEHITDTLYALKEVAASEN